MFVKYKSKYYSVKIQKKLHLHNKTLVAQLSPSLTFIWFTFSSPHMTKRSAMS
jgi:hypothetical protein